MAAQKVSLHKETATKTMAHNDRTLYKEDYFKDAETPEHWTPFGDTVTVAESEMRIYRELFSDALMAQNERALAMYKPERVMTMEQWHEKHMPQEIVFGVGNAENPGTIEEAGLLAWRLKEIVEASGGTVISIDLHRERMFDDEDDVAAIRRGDKTVEECPYVVGSGHGHMRVVWAHEGKVDVANTLEAHGFLREKPDQKRTKRNNESKTFTAFARTSLEDYAEHTLGLEIDRTRDKGAASLSPRDYANMKQAVRKMQEREQQADIAIEAAREAARHDMAHSMFMAEIAAEQDAQMIRDAVLVDATARFAELQSELDVVAHDLDEASDELELARKDASRAKNDAQAARRRTEGLEKRAQQAIADREKAQADTEALRASADAYAAKVRTDADEAAQKELDEIEEQLRKVNETIDALESGRSQLAVFVRALPNTIRRILPEDMNEKASKAADFACNWLERVIVPRADKLIDQHFDDLRRDAARKMLKLGEARARLRERQMGPSKNRHTGTKTGPIRTQQQAQRSRNRQRGSQLGS